MPEPNWTNWPLVDGPPHGPLTPEERMEAKFEGEAMPESSEDFSRRLACGVIAGLIAVLVLALALTARADNLQDLRDAEKIGLPYCAHWAVRAKISNGPGNPVIPGGYTIDWHVQQVRKGHRFLPSVNLPGYAASYDREIAQHLTPFAADFKWVSDNKLPLCIRTLNIGDFAYGQNGQPDYRYRIYTDATSATINPLWTLKDVPTRWRFVDGKPDDEKEVDPLAPTATWGAEGYTLASGKYVQTLQNLCPSPCRVIHLQNNEAGEDKAAKYITGDGNAALTLSGLQPLETIAARSQRVADLVETYPPGTSGDQLKLDFALGRQKLFAAFYRGFRDGLSPPWQEHFRSSSYGCISDPRTMVAARVGFDQIGYTGGMCSQGALPPWYLLGTTDCGQIGFGMTLNWTLAHSWLRQRDPSYVPGMSIKINSAGAIGAAKAGLHEPLTPDRWAGAVLWQVWGQHERATPFEVRDFWESSSMPMDRIFTDADVPDLQRLGCPEIATATKGDYFESVMTAVDRVSVNETIRRFWLEGTPVLTGGTPLGDFYTKKYTKTGPVPAPGDTDRRARLLDCPLNDPPAKWGYISYGNQILGKVKVWAVATEIAAERRVLIYSWSPFRIAEPVSVTVPGYGTFPVSVASPRGNYTVVEPPPPPKFVTRSIE